MQRLLVTNLLILLYAPLAFAQYDFSAADDLFLRRDAGLGIINSAIDQYELAISDSKLNPIEQIYVAEQQATLLALKVQLVPQKERGDVASTCVKKVARITPQQFSSETPQYYYWTAVCMMLQAEAVGIIQSLRESPTILRLIEAGMQLDRRYEGGGFDRLAGILYSRLPMFNPYGPTGNLSRALNYFQRSLDSSAYPHPFPRAWRDQSFEAGQYMYPTHVYYAEALIATGEHNEASIVIDQALSDIEAEEYSAARKAETIIAAQRLKALRRQL